MTLFSSQGLIKRKIKRKLNKNKHEKSKNIDVIYVLTLFYSIENKNPSRNGS
ncbi:hypothetical protein [Clostridium ganghwense]|uniref:hypothetical protein n=1 Tax=Clostridium ganghwense TaxID=312089 RepID=UPI00227A1B4C|nr:hypothetical protein [Clostridium ganghwense]